MLKSEKLNLKLMKKIFEETNKVFLETQRELILSNVSERAWYTQFAICFTEKMKEYEIDSCYVVDSEYNRNNGKLKTILNDDLIPVEITCDLILHSRGKCLEQDNLICIEMKKSTTKENAKVEDKNRVRILTKESFDDLWSYDGKIHPEHVCRYILGVYYEINIRKKEIYIEYYNKGEKIKEYYMEF